ncbi:MAG TPA: hypothetical protein VF548_16590 [Allosphingosinicella sp.]|jgi:hypothetical protein
MRLAFLTLALALPAASPVLPAAPPPAGSQRLAAAAPIPSRFCRDALKVRPVASRGASKPKRLGELPPGDLTLTVVNLVGDCIEPVVVRDGFGAFGRR